MIVFAFIAFIVDEEIQVPIRGGSDEETKHFSDEHMSENGPTFAQFYAVEEHPDLS